MKISKNRLETMQFYDLCNHILITKIKLNIKTIDEKLEDELKRQKRLHPDNSKKTMKDWILIIAEEIGEAIRAYNNKDSKEFVLELIQVMALNLRYLYNK